MYDKEPIVAQTTQPETVIGDYRIIKSLGRGTTGEVKLSQHTATGQYYALKVIPKKTVIDFQQVTV